MAQSSIEWYAKETAKITLSALRGGMTATEHRVLQDAALIKAKEMHKEELKKCAETFEICYYDGIHNGTTFSEYYNEEFGGNNEPK